MTRPLLLATTALFWSACAWGQPGPGVPTAAQINAPWYKTVINSAMVCDWNGTTGTDNTAAFAADITAAESATSQGVGYRLILPSGNCLTGPQTITGQIEIDGANGAASVLVLKSGSTTPLFTLAPAGYNFPGDGHPNGLAYFRNFRATSVDSATNNATYPNASAFSFPSGGAWSMWSYLYNVTIYNMPGDGIKGANWNGFVDISDSYIKANGGNGINSNSNVDWVISGVNLDGNFLDNLVSSGDGQLYVHNLNSYSAKHHGVHLYGAETATFDGHNEFNLNSYAGMYLDKLTSGAVISVSDTVLSQNSQVSTATWADVSFYGGSGGALFTRAIFFAPYAVNPGNSELGNVYFQGGATGVATCRDCTFLAGNQFSTNVTNAAAQLITSAVLPGGNYINGVSVSLGGALSTAGALSTTGSYSVALAASGNTMLALPTTGTLATTATFAAPPSIGNTTPASGVFTTLKAQTATQYTGFTVSNGTNNLMVVQGQSSGNDGADMQLLSSGAAQVQLCAYNCSNFLNFDLWLGNNSSNASPGGHTLRATDGSGTNVAGGTLTLSGGRGTGSGAGGPIIFQAASTSGSGTAMNSGVSQLEILSVGEQMLNALTSSTTGTCGSGNAGTIERVSDATSPVVGAAYVGGGSSFAIIDCNGSAFNVMAK